MTAIITVRAVNRPAEVLICLMETDNMGQSVPAPDAEWRLVDTIQPGKKCNFYAHTRKAIIVRDAP